MSKKGPFTGQYYEKADFIIQAVKILVVPLPFIYTFGWLYGLVANYLAFMVYYKVLSVTKGFEKLSALDEFFLLDNAKNRANVVSVTKMDKVTDVNALRKKIIGLATVRPRLSHKLTKFGGEYFFQKMNTKELAAAIETSFVIREDIKTDTDIENLMAHEQATRDALDTLQYKIIMVPEFQKDQSLIFLKVAHVLGDGVSMMVMISSLNDSGYERSNFPNLIPKFSLVQKVIFQVLNLILIPYSVVLA